MSIKMEYSENNSAVFFKNEGYFGNCDHFVGSESPTVKIRKNGSYTFSHRTDERWQEPSDNGCHSPNNNSNY